VKARLISGAPSQLQLFGSGVDEIRHYSSKLKEKVMNKKIAFIVLSICMAAPSFAGDVVGHSVVVAGKDSGKVVTTASKDTAKATLKAVKFLF
jgi:hypothetical protein